MADLLHQEQEIGNNDSNVTVKNEITKLWVQNSEFLNNDDSTVYSSSAVENSDNDDIGNDMNNLNAITNLEVNKSDVLQNFFKGDNNVQALGNIQISDSKNIHIGNVMYVSGPLHITSSSTTAKLPNNMQIYYTGNDSKKAETSKDKNTPSFSNTPRVFDQYKEEMDRTTDSNILKIMDRALWFAMPPKDFEVINGPVPYVVIAHTATELTTTKSETISMVKNIQAYHVNSMDWDDIGYSFLIGGEGNVYEGRGWGIVGAHTYGYNKNSVGISFIGCFMSSLPPDVSLEACKLLIQQGVSEGHIHPDYKLLAHCQCTPIESPGRMLFNELQKWPHWFNIGKK